MEIDDDVEATRARGFGERAYAGQIAVIDGAALGHHALPQHEQAHCVPAPVGEHVEPRRILERQERRQLRATGHVRAAEDPDAPVLVADPALVAAEAGHRAASVVHSVRAHQISWRSGSSNGSGTTPSVANTYRAQR